MLSTPQVPASGAPSPGAISDAQPAASTGTPAAVYAGGGLLAALLAGLLLLLPWLRRRRAGGLS